MENLHCQFSQTTHVWNVYYKAEHWVWRPGSDLITPRRCVYMRYWGVMINYILLRQSMQVDAGVEVGWKSRQRYLCSIDEPEGEKGNSCSLHSPLNSEWAYVRWSGEWSMSRVQSQIALVDSTSAAFPHSVWWYTPLKLVCQLPINTEKKKKNINNAVVTFMTSYYRLLVLVSAVRSR